MINIIIDTRETALISNVKDRELGKYSSDISIQVEALDIGDITIIFDSNTLVFERKTVSDLISSVKDGRYKEQKSRLLASGNRITYIIEGDDIISSRNDRHQNILSGAYLHTIYRDNINVIFTRNVSETTTFLLTLTAKIIENPQYFIQNQQNINQSEYIDCVKIKSKKIDNITPDNCFVMQLSQIPFISKTIAKNIQNVYPNMKSLIKALEDADDNGKVKLLCNIEKIGFEKANKILHYLHY